MIDWGIVATVAGGGFGTTIAVLVILSLVAWIVGLVIQKTTKTTTESKEDSEKG
jgi:Na+-transporting methylmalonyl-CoA/oxaloacetate decarboxylase gamma subunit